MNPNHAVWAIRSGLRLTALSLVLMLAGCTILETQPPARVIEPQIALPEARAIEPALGTVRVLRPTTDQTRDSRRMLVRRADSTLQLLSNHLWLDSVPDLLRGLIVRSLEHSNAFTDAHTGGPSQWLLASEIRRFEAADLGTGSVTVEIDLQLRLLQQNSGEIVARHSLKTEARASSSDAADIVRAFEQALNQAMLDLTDWTVETVQSQTQTETE